MKDGETGQVNPRMNPKMSNLKFAYGYSDDDSRILKLNLKAARSGQNSGAFDKDMSELDMSMTDIHGEDLVRGL